MNLKDIIDLIIFLLLGILSLYFRYSSKLAKEAHTLIATAEQEYIDSENSGSMKHAFVVEKLYSLIPKPLKLIFTKQAIALIVDNTFYAIETYANIQVEKAKSIEKAEKIETDTTDKKEDTTK